jgi:N-acetylglucosamine-6-phosphate deacetylase
MIANGGGPIVARDVASAREVEIHLDGSRIARVRPVEPDPDRPASTRHVAPAFWDIQTNGRWGISFSDPNLTPAQVAEIVQAQAEMGTARLCPTLITAPFETMRHGVATIAAAVEESAEVARMVLGIHLEGPSISEIDGYRGAHPMSAVRDPDWDEFQRLQDAANDLITLITLAPERPGAIGFIERAVAAGITIAIGHTAADAATIAAAVSAGATLSTHLGNGIASTLPRHPNPIWTQAADDRLFASLIADGHHLDRSVLKTLIRAKRPRSCVIVSDASPLAGLPPGRYGDWAVDPSGKIVVAGTPYLAGSNRDISAAINEVMAADPSLSLAEILAMTSANAAIAIGCMIPKIETGWPANMILFEHDNNGFRLVSTIVDGRLVPRGAALRASESVIP